jgi:hypothetical protein
MQLLWPAVKYEVTITDRKKKQKASSTSIICKLATSFSYKKLSGNSGGQHKQVSLFVKVLK